MWENGQRRVVGDGQWLSVEDPVSLGWIASDWSIKHQGGRRHHPLLTDELPETDVKCMATVSPIYFGFLSA